MSTRLNRLHGGRAITWRTVIGLLLVPLTAAGILLWGLWNPTDRLDTVTAAVVNLDEPVTVDGQLTPLGRVVAAELIGGEEAGFTWVLTDADDAGTGLGDGRYTAVVTIPENFSSAATSFARGPAEAETATIDIETSDRGRLLDAALSNIVVNTATTVLNAQLGSSFVGGIFVGMSELGTGMGEAADGASALADGIAQLADGADSLAGGTAELSNGVQQLSSGASGLASGARQAATGGAQLADGVEAYTSGINQALGGLQATAPEMVAQLQALRALIADPATPLPEGVDRDTLLAQLDALLGGVGGLDAQLGQLIAGGTQLATGVRASANGQAQLASGLESYAAGMGALAAGTPALADGAAQLAGGARSAADGAGDLAEGLGTAAEEIPSYTEAEREKLARTAVRPVEASGSSDELFNASGVPLFAGIALWAGALASFLVLAPLWRRTREAARGVAGITLRSALPAVAIGAAQGVIAGLLLPPLLGYGAAEWLGFLGLSLLAGISFSLVNQGLSALLGGFGRFLAFALLVVAFAIGVVSTAPPVLQAIGDASPIGALFSGFQAVAMGTSGGGAAAGLLVLWGLGGLILTAFAVRRARRSLGAEG
ncbi:MAG: YhgE/Pip family protein [Leucobacter sp.]